MSTQEKSFENLLNGDSIDDEFINGIVANKLNVPSSSFKVTLVLISPATKPNENYLGLVCRTKIKVRMLETNEFKILDVIVKVAQEMTESLGELNVYQREKIMYENILSKFEGFLFDKLSEKVRFGPSMLMFKNEPSPIIVLDDLKAEGYSIVDRKEGLSLEQAKSFLSKLASFHAAGAKVLQSEGMLFDCFDRNNPNAPKSNPEDPLAIAFVRMHEEFVSALKSYGGCDEYANKVEKWDRDVLAAGYMYESKPMKCGLQVLNHGDVWTNNMMFKLDTNEVLIIDYQLCFWGSPCYDLLSFLTASVHDDVKVKHFDELVEFYYREFTKTLGMLEYSNHIPSLDELKEDIMDKGYILAGFLIFLFFAKYSSPKEFSFDMLMFETDEDVLRELYDRLFQDEYFVRGVKTWLPFMNERGFLDILIPSK
ncbi:unnamed protein product [Chironomus riparius]|uniref:CHK kinase-like domain-containing protein n=1 Tax=Chironomus riparius TaxID=315576 RepID=A0A9N9RPX3_9DIPT|nr:unnamed protein product [Chironomus riparius]